jgi:hypothetical protein
MAGGWVYRGMLAAKEMPSSALIHQEVGYTGACLFGSGIYLELRNKRSLRMCYGCGSVAKEMSGSALMYQEQ